MIGKASDPMLAKAEQAFITKINPELQKPLMDFIGKGLTFLYAPENAAGLKQKIAATKNPATEAGQGAVRLAMKISNESGGKTDPKILSPAENIFALEYLDLLAKAGKCQITPELIAKTAESVAHQMLSSMKVTPDQLHQMVVQGKQGGAQPQQAPQPPAGGLINVPAPQGAM